MRFLKNLFLYFFIFINSEIEDLEEKNEIFEINVISNISIDEDKEIFRAGNQVLNNPLDKNYIISIKPRTVPVSGFTSKTLYLGYPVSGAISTNPFPTTTEFGLVCLIGDDYNLSGHYILTNSSLGWKLGTPNQKNPILISSFENNLIVGPGNGINNEMPAGTQKSYGNTVFGSNNIQELSNNPNANLNTVFGIGNFLIENNTTEKKFSINNAPNKVNFNTVIGSYNFLSGSARLPISLSDISGKNFLGSLSNGSQSDIVTVGSFNALNVNGGQNTNSSMVIVGNENLIGVDTSKNIIAIGQQNLISDRPDRNDFRKLESDIFIGNNILNKGLDTSIITPIAECIFINSKKNDVTKPVYDPINFAQNQILGSIFINALGPIKKINRSNKTYIGNTKNPFDDDDFDISIGDPAPVVLLSTTDNRIGSVYKIFDLSNYEKNRAGILSDVLTEFKRLKLMSFSKNNTNKSYFFIDFSNINSTDFPILSSYLVKDDKKNPIGFESYFALPIMIEILNNTSAPIIDDNNILRVEHENVTVSGSTLIDAKNNSSFSSNDSNSTCFNLLLNGENLMKGYSNGDLTIGNTEKKLHLYGSEIILNGNGGINGPIFIQQKDPAQPNKPIKVFDIENNKIGNDTICSINIGTSSQCYNNNKCFYTNINMGSILSTLIFSASNIIFGQNNTVGVRINLDNLFKINNPNGSSYYMLMVDSSGQIYRSASAILASTVNENGVIVDGNKSTIQNTNIGLYGYVRINNNDFSKTGTLVDIRAGNKKISIGNSDTGDSLEETGNLTIGNTTGFTHLYGGTDFTIRTANGGASVLSLGVKDDNSKISIESGINEIQINKYSTGNINIGNSTGILSLGSSAGSSIKIILKSTDSADPDGSAYYMLMLDSNGNVYKSKSAVLANTVSSRKYKENIKKAEVDLEKFKKLLPVIFDYKKEMNSGKKNQWGFIAEDVFDLGLIEAVEFDENGEIYGLNYRTIFMMLLTSYLDSLKNLENLKAENEELKDKVFAIEKKLENIEKILIL